MINKIYPATIQRFTHRQIFAFIVIDESINYYEILTIILSSIKDVGLSIGLSNSGKL